LEDVHTSLKEFSEQQSVVENAALSSIVKTSRHKTKKLRKMTTELSTLWDRAFEDND
jgi:hypothetical protein